MNDLIGPLEEMIEQADWSADNLRARIEELRGHLSKAHCEATNLALVHNLTEED